MTQNPKPRTQNLECNTQNPESRTKNPEPRTLFYPVCPVCPVCPAKYLILYINPLLIEYFEKSGTKGTKGTNGDYLKKDKIFQGEERRSEYLF